MDNQAGRSEATTTLRVTTVSNLVAAYVSNNHVVPDQIAAVFSSFEAQVDRMLGFRPAAAATAVVEPAAEAASDATPKREPAVPIKRSVTPDHIISLFDGRKMKSLKRYLRTQHNMSPQDYIAYWGLPKDYPMTAPNYTARRSELAKASGLGRRRAAEPSPAPAKGNGRRKAGAPAHA